MKRLLFLAVLVCVPAGVAGAIEDDGNPPESGGVLSGGSILVGIIAPGSSGGEYVSAGNAPSPYTYTWVPVQGDGDAWIFRDQCDAGGTAGREWMLIVRDLAGAIVDWEVRCITGEPPDLRVPTIAEIWSAAMRDIPGPRPGINPRPTGLTGLETWLWYDGPREVAISTGVRGWTVTGTARVVEVTFDMGDGQEVSSATGGSEAEPAARYVYETKGDYDVVVTARWEADVVLSGPGLPGGRPTPIGSAVLRGTERYPVQEVRGLLVKE